MGAIIPAILPTSREDLESKLARLDGLVGAVQVDIVDGRYASPASWPYTERGGEAAREDFLPYLGHFHFEFDLMVENPGLVAGAWIDHGVNRLTLHADHTRDLGAVIEKLQVTYGHDKGFAPDLLSLGLAVGVETDLALIEPHLDRADYVQFMGIRTIGHQGEPFDNRVVRRIVAFRKAHSDMPIQVDGGVNLHTAPVLLDAGVSRLIVGSDLWKAPSLTDELAKFEALAEEYGIYEK
ncbi:MAG TPA: HisA/HisF-related TIM barrel protein [Candidatus Paceibacterota bacterium]|nr:HisA/HisF-related TIM barrel protein [Candidatus Paceibacterota bacterium]